MYEIVLKEKINAPSSVVWGVITNTDDYPLWNSFVVACESSFKVGEPIIMQVRLAPSKVRRQRETISQNKEAELLEYITRAPLGMLSSWRRHLLTPIDSNTTMYESVFILKGLFSPLVKRLVGAQLQKGFSDMTRGLVERAQTLHQNSLRPVAH